MNEETERVIEVKDLTKVFRDFWRRPKVRALDGVSFEVKRGEVFGLLGPNGSGKSTTLKTMLGLLYPTSGTIEMFGRSPRDVKAKALVGYLPEESYLYGYLTAEETLEFYGKLFDLSGKERHERTRQLLEMTDLQHAAHRTVGEFSKGMARRVGLAQALINDPELIVLDEPTSGLDPIGRRHVKDLILTLAKRGKTVFLASHLLADVEDVCDRIAVLYDGRIRVEGPVKELLEDRDTSRLTMHSVSPEALKRVLALIREQIGTEPHLDHSSRSLEDFFLGVVRDAAGSEDTESSRARTTGIADYLSTGELVSKE